MILQPVLPVALVIIVALGGVGVAVWALAAARGARARTMWVLRIVLVLACALMVLRPGVPGGKVETLVSDADVVLVVDTTASIVAEDWNGDEPRLEGVRSDIDELVARYRGARFALITFDVEANLRVPLTTDMTALSTALAVLRPEPTAHSRGSSIGTAAALLERTLESAASVTPDRARLVFYLGDGEQTATGVPESFASSASLIAGGAVLGYGTSDGGRMRATMPGVGGAGEYIHADGRPALSRIDMANLERVAEQLGVEAQQRSAGTELVAPPVPTSVTVSSATTGSIAEFTWAVALVVAALLLIEVAQLVAGLVALGRVPRAVRVGRQDAGDAS